MFGVPSGEPQVKILSCMRLRDLGSRVLSLGVSK